MTDRDTCRYPLCSEPPREDVSGFAGRFCSTAHELKYEHVKADAEDAKRAEQLDRSETPHDHRERL